MFLPAATLHDVGAFATSTRQVPSGPPACGQWAMPSRGIEASRADVASAPESDDADPDAPPTSAPAKPPPAALPPLPESLPAAPPLEVLLDIPLPAFPLLVDPGGAAL